ncbi:hypothetical protein F4802DRAFT_578149 [Xylaria palmicola]|nr:hypothetical protein F4802DRAFT_578149 [Xylaria palmicola]
MLNTGPQGGWGSSATIAPPNPFESATPPAAGNPFAKPAPNPFLRNSNVNKQIPANNPFGSSATKTNPFSKSRASSPNRSASPSFKQTGNNAITTRNPFESARQETSAPGRELPKSSIPSIRHLPAGLTANNTRRVAEFVQPAWANGSDTPGTSLPDIISLRKRKGDLSAQNIGRNARNLPVPNGMVGKRSPSPRLGANISSILPRGVSAGSSVKHDGRSYELASKIQHQLAKDRITPPQWPSNPGSHTQRQAMENFRESYKAYREKARKSLIKAGLVDDPDQRRTLQQALDFRGISEDMCPEWEKATRIIEYDVRNPEKAPDDKGDLVAIPSLMVKRLARSAAGQDAPLPMDVRSFATLRKTLDYLIDDLIPDDSFLPSKHNFLWDRTRAIRIDLSVQKYNLTPDERTDLIYCLETIARFHVTALHLLSQEGFAAEDFSEQQEIEQLGKTLISLKELYDDCAEQGIECVNEAEFRGYYIVFNARNPSIKETVEGWGSRLWDTAGIRTAMCLVESLQNTWTLQGPLNPYAPTEIALGAAAIFFSIVSSPEISYTMACFAEIHFNDVRKSMLQILRKAYTRPRDGPKDITPAFLKARLRFDTEDEAVDFAEKHGIVFGQDGTHQYAILNSRQSVEDPRIRHAFSHGIVERKRSGRSLPDIIHHTIYQTNGDEPKVLGQESSLFVAESENSSSDTQDSLAHNSVTVGPGASVLASAPISIASQSTTLKPDSSLLSTSSPQVISHPFLTSKSTTTAKPIVAEPAPTGRLSPHHTTSSPFSQIYQPPLGTASAGVSNSSKRNLPDSNASASVQHTKDNPENNTSSTLAPSASTGIFSFLNQNKDGYSKPADQPTSNSPFGVVTKPSLFRDDAGGTSLQTPAAQLSTSISPSPLKLPSAPTQPQNNDLNRRPLFEHTLSPVVPNNDGAQTSGPSPSRPPPKSSSSFPSTGQGSNTPIQTGSIKKPSTLSRIERAESDIREQASVAVLATTKPPKDPMGDFTRWFVLADKGLMKNQLEEFAVEHILKSTWEKFKTAEEARRRQEEDKKSWAEALKFRHYSLKVTYFYRWRNITRKRRVIKRIQLEKEKARLWRAPQHAEEREIAVGQTKEKAIQEAKELVGKMSKERALGSTWMQESTQSQQSLEEALLGTGVFSGVRDERAAVRHVSQCDNPNIDDNILPAEELRLRSENQRRRKHGLAPLKRFPVAKPYKEGSKTAMLRAISSGTGRDSLSMSTGSLRNSTFSSSYRSSLGYNRSRVAKFRSSASDPYWRMKANGLVQMPNGEYLHETLALPMLREGKRFPGIGDYGLPPQESFTPSQSPPAGLNIIPDSDSPTPARFIANHRESRSPSILDGVTQKRKRTQAEDEDLAAYRNEASATRKRAKSGDRAAPETPSADQNFLDSIAALLNKVTAATASSSL